MTTYCDEAEDGTHLWAFVPDIKDFRICSICGKKQKMEWVDSKEDPA